MEHQPESTKMLQINNYPNCIIEKATGKAPSGSTKIFFKLSFGSYVVSSRIKIVLIIGYLCWVHQGHVFRLTTMPLEDHFEERFAISQEFLQTFESGGENWNEIC
ncbi:uncharacterized protein LOC143231495 [Tachypleus tridentatus]|uniref:uncharacterized protein LOC143231495 n=1 Tax=Tachypleus tridentatus TaxID=6853 RepID=UPI003FD214DF